jgi:hypothetical protein
MRKKHTYKPTSTIKYKKGGKNKKKKSYKSDGKHYKAQNGGFNPFQFLVEPIASLFGISSVQNMLGGDALDDDIDDFGGVYGIGQAQQAGAAGTGVDMAGAIATGMDFDPSNLTSVATLQDQIDNIGIARPRKASTEFIEGVKDSITQQTTGVLSDIGRTGKMTGIKDVLGATDDALIKAQEKAAGMDERYQQQLTDIEKFETGQTSQLVGQQAQQQFGAATDMFGLAGDLASQSAAAGGDLSASAIAGLVELQGQQAAATADLIGGAFETLLGMIPGLEEGGMIEEKKDTGEYEEGDKQNMMPANEADVTPGKFSHEENPIDIVQEGEKIGEMTGGEAIMPPKDVAEFEKLLADGDKNAVFSKLKQLFDKWEKKAREHKEKNLDQAAMGAKIKEMPKTKIK